MTSIYVIKEKVALSEMVYQQMLRHTSAFDDFSKTVEVIESGHRCHSLSGHLEGAITSEESIEAILNNLNKCTHLKMIVNNMNCCELSSERVENHGWYQTSKSNTGIRPYTEYNDVRYIYLRRLSILVNQLVKLCPPSPPTCKDVDFVGTIGNWLHSRQVESRKKE